MRDVMKQPQQAPAVTSSAAPSTGDSVQPGANLVRTAKQVESLTADDIDLLKRVVIDKETGHMVILAEGGELVDMNDE